MNTEDKKILTTIVERHALVCALCMYREPGGKAKTALTVIAGYAVCEDHLGYVAQGQRFAGILRSVRREP